MPQHSDSGTALFPQNIVENTERWKKASPHRRGNRFSSLEHVAQSVDKEVEGKFARLTPRGKREGLAIPCLVLGKKV